MKRRLLNLLSLLSLLLCVAVVALWVRSCWHNDLLARFHADGKHWWLSSNSDGVFLVTQPSGYVHGRARSWTHHRAVGVVWSRGVFADGENDSVGVRHWLVALIAALPAVPAFCRTYRWWTRRGWRIAGLCPACGYDLRATPGKCPECGHVPAAVTT